MSSESDAMFWSSFYRSFAIMYCVTIICITIWLIMNDLVDKAMRETAKKGTGYIEHLGELRLQIRELKTEIQKR